eukprot:9372700-Pyramimonas_sp.AAC.2
MAVPYNIMDTAAHSDGGARVRQIVRNILRKRPALTLDSEEEYLESIIRSDNVRRPRFKYEDQRQVSEWLTTALRHKPFRN